jgi:hypothetical protein
VAEPEVPGGIMVSIESIETKTLRSVKGRFGNPRRRPTLGISVTKSIPATG